MMLKLLVERPDQGNNVYRLGYGSEKTLFGFNSAHLQGESEGFLELAWFYGTEKDPNFKYHDGNSEPQSFGHICVSVDDIEPACERLERNGVNFAKRLKDGRMHNLAFALGKCG